jgi:hypothetical protein
VADTVQPALEPVRKAFRAIAEAIVPEAGALDAQGWRELERVVEAALATRPARLRRQLVILIRALEALPRLRYGSPLSALDRERRERVLSRVQDAPLLPLRRGFWGLRTLVLMGYYGRAEAAAALGYRADPRGWEARR